MLVVDVVMCSLKRERDLLTTVTKFDVAPMAKLAASIFKTVCLQTKNEDYKFKTQRDSRTLLLKVLN